METLKQELSSKVIKKDRRLMGVVTSDKMDKTVVVTITRVKMHPKYQKQYEVSRRFKVHDEKDEYKVGDKVIIQETRPLSKDKRWRVKGLVSDRGRSYQTFTPPSKH